MIEAFIQSHGLWAIFLLMAANGFFSAPPSELILPLAGLIALTSDHTLIETVVVASLGNLIGTYVLFLIGRSIGVEWLLNIRHKLMQKGAFLSRIARVMPNKKTITAMNRLIEEQGKHIVCWFRCVPYVRSIVSIPAGMARMNHSSFLTYSVIGILVWAIFWQGTAYVIGYSWVHYSRGVAALLTMLIVMIILVMRKRIGVFLNRYFRNDDNL